MPEQVMPSQVVSWTDHYTISNVKLVRPEPKPEEFWTIDIPKDGKSNPRHRSSKEPLVLVIHDARTGQALRIDGKVGPIGPEYTVSNSYETLLSYHPATGITYDPGEQVRGANGEPNVLNKDLLALTSELHQLIESSPSMAKNERYQRLLKPRLDVYMELAK